MKKLYLGFLLLLLSAGAAFADVPDWAKNKIITQISSAIEGKVSVGNYILCTNATWNKYLKEGSTVGSQLLAVDKNNVSAPCDVAYAVRIDTLGNDSTYTIQLASGNYIGQFTFSNWGDSVISSATAENFYITETPKANSYYNIKSTSNNYWLNINTSGPVTWTAAADSSDSNSAYQLLPVTLTDAYTVTYIVKNSSGDTIYTAAKLCPQNGNYPTAPATVEGFYTITGTQPTGEVSKDTTFVFTYNQGDNDSPRISSSTTDGNAKWYAIKARTDKPWIALSKTNRSGVYCNPFTSYKITSLFQSGSITYDDIKNAQLWCITGDPFNGLRFHNKYNGYVIATGSATTNGTNCIMSSTTTDATSLFDLTKTTGSPGGFQASIHGGTQYLSDWGGDEADMLKFYSVGAASDAGSALTFFEDSVMDITTSNLEAVTSNNANYYVGSTTTSITIPASTTNTGEALFNESYKADSIGIEKDKYYKIYCNRTDVTVAATDNRYVTTEGCSFTVDGTLTSSNYNDSEYPRTITRTTASGAEVPMLWQFEEQATEGTYKIRNANTNRVWSSATGSSIDQPLDDSNGGVFTPTAVSGKVATYQLIYGSTHYVNAYNGMGETLLQNYDHDASDAGGYWAIIPVDSISLTIYSDTQYASAKYPFGVTLPEGLTAYIATKAEGGSTNQATLTSIGQSVPAKTPVIIGVDETITADTSYKLAINNAVTASTDANLLDGATVSRKGFATDSVYVLTTNNSTATFKKNGSVTTIPANKAYLSKTKVTNETNDAAQLLYFNFGKETSISTIATEAKDAQSEVYYDLRGRRVLYPAHGIFVKANGQKIYIK